jgi:hypothetical protein
MPDEVAQFQVKVRLVRGVEIFAPGNWNGDEYTEADLDSMVESFYALKGRVDPPVKLGHTSDEFNTELARKMGVEPGVVTGEQGKGQIALGWVENLRRKGSILVADFTNVPEPLAELIESRSYRKVSAEIYIDWKDSGNNYPLVLCGVALLGAEPPAVSTISGLEKVAVYSHLKTADKVVEMDTDDFEKTLGDMWNALVGKIRERIGKKEPEEKPKEEPEDQPICETEEDMKDVNLALGLAEDAKPEVIIAKIQELQNPSEPKEFTDMKAQFSQSQETIKKLEADLRTERRGKRLVELTEKAKAWQSISGKPEEIAERILKVEEVDVEAAKTVIALFEETNKNSVVTQPLGTPVKTDEELTSFQKIMNEKLPTYSGRNAYAKCFSEMGKKYPKEYKEFLAKYPDGIVK